MFLARLLEKEAMGVYFIALMVAFLLKLMSDLGVDLAFVKQYPEENKAGKSDLLLSAFVIRIFSCTAVSLLYIAVENSGLISFINDISHLTLLTLGLYWMHSFRELLLRLLQAQQIFSVYAGAQVLAAILKAILICSLVFLQTVSVEQVLVIEIFAFAASIVYGATRIGSTLKSALKARAVGIIQILRFGYPLYLNALLNLGNEKVSQYIVAGFGGPLAMAYFGVAERLADAGTRLFESFANVYYPTQARHFADGKPESARQFADRSMLWITFIITSGIIAFTIIREPIIILLFTEKYISVANPAALFFVVLLLRSTQTLMGYFGVSAGEKFLPVKVSLVSSVVNVVLCLYMFKNYGYQGTIVALVLTQLIMNALYFSWLGKAGHRFTLMPLLTMSGICILGVIAVYLLENHFWLSTIVFPVFIVITLGAIPQLRRDIIIAKTMANQFMEDRSRNSKTNNA